MFFGARLIILASLLAGLACTTSPASTATTDGDDGTFRATGLSAEASVTAADSLRVEGDFRCHELMRADGVHTAQVSGGTVTLDGDRDATLRIRFIAVLEDDKVVAEYDITAGAGIPVAEFLMLRSDAGVLFGANDDPVSIPQGELRACHVRITIPGQFGVDGA